MNVLQSYVNFMCDCARISMKRESAVSKEVLAELSSGSGKKLTKAEKDER